MSETGEESLPPLGVWMRQLAIGVGGLILLALPFAIFARPQISAIAHTFTDRYGLRGLFFSVLVVDTIPLLTNEPLMLAGHAGGLGFWPVLVVSTTASILAGPLGWLIGRIIGRWGIVQRLFERYHVHTFLHRYGFRTVAFGALPSPLPYAISTLASGAVNLPLRVVFWGSLFRIPKCLITFVLIVFVWHVGGDIAAR